MSATLAPVSVAVKNDLTSSFTSLITRIQASIQNVSDSAIDLTDVANYITGILATDTQAEDNTNNVNLITPHSANIAAQKAISDWVGATPEALDTLQEIATALNDDANAVDNLLAQIGTKAETSYVDSQLALKASITYVDNGLAEKADQTAMTSALALKASISAMDSGDQQVHNDATDKVSDVYVEFKALFDGAFV